MQRLSWIIRMSLIVITSLSKRERRMNRKQRLERREEAPLLAWRAEEGDRELRNAGSLWKPVKERKQVLVLHQRTNERRSPDPLAWSAIQRR